MATIRQKQCMFLNTFNSFFTPSGKKRKKKDCTPPHQNPNRADWSVKYPAVHRTINQGQPVNMYMTNKARLALCNAFIPPTGPYI